ncbi:hypothetical protein SPRG_10264 [Saprolegnia parasitica CBS 223.65]|uniref:Right handed beta helix domain-containing protein n=1 Tax=Saprolegnia parasitica (strain CBS 223.65) TaxID=695850 RepID=A0A067C6H5_SAPPC|nr:hypothetical protein SPRG_10264 [Saprolegnia parasitica CBS 223.65]KDO24730.1 hypothetical protein SPRG_10264 [Saprolegnia parasitica CBS 223.65]|eukprot:XP_012204610.1 hypothetical protein SPRG_10264 [Saprolegnia parasitica CBS 223.65]
MASCITRLLFAATGVAATTSLFVDPNVGNDATNDGSLSRPLQTLAKAQTVVRSFCKRSRAGTHAVPTTLSFGPQDSGASATARVTYKAYCNPTALSDLTILPYPYVMNSTTQLRYLWNGVNSPSTSTTLPPLALPPVCFDLVGVGHTCYTVEAPCVSDCMTACQRNVDKRIYSTAVYDQFYLLFGRDLHSEDECVGLCVRMCSTCEQPILSGMQTITNGAWALFAAPAWMAPLSPIYSLSLAGRNVQTITELYLNGDTRLPRAGFPNSNGSYGSQYAPAFNGSARSFAFDPTSFSAKTAHWTNLASIAVEVRLSSGANVWYNAASLVSNVIGLGAGGGTLSPTVFQNGVPWNATTARVRAENIFAEFYDATTSMLYVIPPAGVSLASASISFPTVKQLLQIQGTPGIDLGYSVPGYYTIITANETETAAPRNQAGWTSHLTFDGLIFTGTTRTEMELYEALPGHPWTQTRVAAVYIESARDIVIRRSTFTNLRGNAIMISGRNEAIHVVHNHFKQLGATAVTVLPRGVTAFPNLSRFEIFNTLLSNISFNQIHDFGLVTTQSAAIWMLSTNQTTVRGNLVYNIPPSGVSYSITNGNGDATKPGYLLRPLSTPVSPAAVLANSLSTTYSVVVDIGRFDIPVVAKLIGAPICLPAQGRGGALYGHQHSGCSGCCPTTSGTSTIRNTALPAITGLAMPLRPGDLLQLQVTSAPYYNAPVDVFVGFHIVTPNRIVEVPNWRFHWQVRTRSCVVATTTQVITCGGPCGCPLTNIASHLSCAIGYDPIPTSVACSGPYDSWSTCQSGVLGRVLYYNCSMTCTTTVCT